MIYLISPFWHEDERVRENRRMTAIRYTNSLIRKGISIFCPLKYSKENITSNHKQEQYWLDFDIEIMRGADEVYVLKIDGWKESNGVALEIREAKKLKLPIKYISNVGSISIMGSRGLTNKQCVDALKEVMTELNPRRLVIPAEPKGACAAGRKFAIDTQTESLLVCKQVQRAGGMYEARTKLVLEESDCCVFLHDGTSKGTRNEIEMCIELGIPYIYYKLSGDVLERCEFIEDDDREDNAFDSFDLDLDLNFDF